MDGLLVGRPRFVLFVLGVVGLAAALASPMSGRASWVGFLPTTVAAFESTVLWLPSILAGAAAWLAGQHRAHGLGDWASVSPRDHRARRLPSVAATLSVALVVQSVSLLVIFVDSARQGMLGAADSPWMLVSVPTTMALTGCWCATGAWLGSTMRPELAIAVSFLAPYVVYVVFVVAADSPLASLAVADGRNFSFVRPAETMWIARGAFWVLLSATLIIRVVRGPTRWFRAAAWATSLSASAALLHGASFPSDPQAAAAHCEGSAPTMCIEQAFRAVLPEYRSAIDEVWPHIPTSLRPSVVTSGPLPDQTGSSTPQRILVAPPVHGFEEPSRIIDRTMFSARVGDSLVLSSCRGPIPASTVAIVIWWRTANNVPIDRPAYVGDWLSSVDPGLEQASRGARTLKKMTLADRDAWFAAHADAIASCRPVELPR
jgi:hypothetical protein